MGGMGLLVSKDGWLAWLTSLGYAVWMDPAMAGRYRRFGRAVCQDSSKESAGGSGQSVYHFTFTHGRTGVAGTSQAASCRPQFKGIFFCPHHRSVYVPA